MDFSIGLAGLNAANRRMEAAALEVSRATIPPQNMTPADNTPDAPTANAAQPAQPAQPAQSQADVLGLADPDLPGALVSQIAASAAFLANVQTIRRTDEAAQALLKLR